MGFKPFIKWEFLGSIKSASHVELVPPYEARICTLFHKILISKYFLLLDVT